MLVSSQPDALASWWHYAVEKIRERNVMIENATQPKPVPLLTRRDVALKEIDRDDARHKVFDTRRMITRTWFLFTLMTVVLLGVIAFVTFVVTNTWYGSLAIVATAVGELISLVAVIDMMWNGNSAYDRLREARKTARVVEAEYDDVFTAFLEQSSRSE